MKVLEYGMELDENRHPMLIREHCSETSMEVTMDNPDTIVSVFRELLRIDKKAEEYFYISAMDIKCHLLAVFEVSHGTINAALVDPKSVYSRALIVGAVNIVAVHNHPSGDCSPSMEDDQTCKRLMEAGNLLGVTLLDFIIIGRNYCSYRAEGRVICK